MSNFAIKDHTTGTFYQGGRSFDGDVSGCSLFSDEINSNARIRKLVRDHKVVHFHIDDYLAFSSKEFQDAELADIQNLATNVKFYTDKTNSGKVVTLDLETVEITFVVKS